MKVLRGGQLAQTCAVAATVRIGNTYLGAAGGFSYKGDKGRVSVRYENGDLRTRRKTFLFTSTPQPGRGAEGFVPVKDTTHRTDYVALVGGMAQVLARLVTIAVVATKL